MPLLKGLQGFFLPHYHWNPTTVSPSCRLISVFMAYVQILICFFISICSPEKVFSTRCGLKCTSDESCTPDSGPSSHPSAFQFHLGTLCCIHHSATQVEQWITVSSWLGVMPGNSFLHVSLSQHFRRIPDFLHKLTNTVQCRVSFHCNAANPLQTTLNWIYRKHRV